MPTLSELLELKPNKASDQELLATIQTTLEQAALDLPVPIINADKDGFFWLSSSTSSSHSGWTSAMRIYSDKLDRMVEVRLNVNN